VATYPRQLSLLWTLLVAACATASVSSQGGQSAAATNEDDELRCANLCKKQRTCVGAAPNDRAIETCARGCVRNVLPHPELLSRLRALDECLDQACGTAYDRCAEQAGAPPVANDTPASEVTPLTASECGLVCAKTFACLGGDTPDPGTSEACVLGCVQGSGQVGAVGSRYRRMFECAQQPCGATRQRCISASHP